MKIGIDLGGTNIRIGQIDGNRLVNKTSAPSPSHMALDESLSYIIVTIERMMHKNIESIGIGVPSVLDIEKGIVYNVANIPSWEEVHLREILHEAFDVPIFINNDSNCFTLGEKRFGEGKPYRNMLGITLGTGVGTGIIINNELYGGSNTGAGELGCAPYLDATYEDYCGSNFFVKHYNATGSELAAKASKNDTIALQIWEQYGVHLGNLIQLALFAYDPDAIIFGGGITNAYPYFEKSMRESIQSFPYTKSLEKLQIGISRNEDIAILGAAALF